MLRVVATTRSHSRLLSVVVITNYIQHPLMFDGSHIVNQFIWFAYRKNNRYPLGAIIQYPNVYISFIKESKKCTLNCSEAAKQENYCNFIWILLNSCGLDERNNKI
ncbi:hypothetical protein HanRHA438_Chr17g0808771 [Helianthus annuus]|nr:hypothetical protein HanIR_Chr17g0866121 [Helianthus annuus]KAJ0825947.1 hypothetical protein HanRHA438_Chr17g0808771 [Helianthus annuus]